MNSLVYSEVFTMVTLVGIKMYYFFLNNYVDSLLYIGNRSQTYFMDASHKLKGCVKNISLTHVNLVT